MRARAREVGKLHKPGYGDEQATLARKLKAKYPELGRGRIARMVTEATGRSMSEKQVRAALKKPLTPA
jgi:hypothetical protein